MKKLKTYAVIVSTRVKWSGTVAASSRAIAKRLGEYSFNDGELRQVDEKIVSVKICEVRS